MHSEYLNRACPGIVLEVQIRDLVSIYPPLTTATNTSVAKLSDGLAHHLVRLDCHFHPTCSSKLTSHNAVGDWVVEQSS